MKPTSPYIVDCPNCGTRATIIFDNGVYVAFCPRCEKSEYGETVEKAARCFATPNPGNLMKP